MARPPPHVTRGLAVLSLTAIGAAGGCASDAIDVYQEHLGEQWAFHCDFQPSCSEYGSQAVEDYGTLAGTLMIADRLLRDHDLSRENYPHDERGHPIDPPAANALFGPRDGAFELDADALAAALAQDRRELEEEPPLVLQHELRDDVQLRFADELFAAGEFERARVEYMRLLHHRPATPHATRCRERIAICLAKAGRRAEALAESERIAEPEERARATALVLRELGRPADALVAADSGASPLLAGMLAFEAGDSAAARARFARLDDPLRSDLLARAGAFDELPSKSRWLAGTLSAVLPGAGQTYAGRPADGAVALLVNGILIGGTVAAARHDEDATAIALGFVAFGFYTGNIYGAVNAAAQHDRAHRADFVTKTRGWLRQNNLFLSLSPRGDGGALGLYFDL